MPTSNFRALRAWRRGDHLHQIRDEIANALTHGAGDGSLKANRHAAHQTDQDCHYRLQHTHLREDE